MHKFTKCVLWLKNKTDKPTTELTADIFFPARFAMQGFRSRELHPILLPSDCQCPEPESLRSPKNNARDRLRCISQPLPCGLCGSVPLASDFNRRNLECRVGDRIVVRRIRALKSKLGDRISVKGQSAIEFP
ncbi:hypothetical protein [Microcoleus sp.]|uniref:hypothetical protein n=1 Tax=Microcoleus sp. TaxID=44472 RepID=UPI00403E6535